MNQAMSGHASARSSVSGPFVPVEVSSLTPFVTAGVLGPAEVHLAAWVARSSGCSDHPVVLAVAMAAWAARHGHSCAELDRIAHVVEREIGRRTVDDAASDEPVPELPWPSVEAWLDALRASPETVVRQTDGWDDVPVFDTRPLVVRGRSVYLQRHWVDECLVASSVRARCVESPSSTLPVLPMVLESLGRLLPAVTADGVADLQRRAADMVLSGRLAIIAGGPGTGKTYSVARILSVLLMQAATEHERPLRVALAAPTGKAAARLRESIETALDDEEVRAVVPESVRAALSTLAPTTVHRLLGPKGHQLHRFRHDAVHPLPHDVVVIDETSMVSAPLLARICEAVRPDARLVLIGDPDQLESVELGAVLGDMVRSAGSTGPLSARVVRLERVRRYGAESPIARLADAVRAADRAAPEVEPAADALAVLRAGDDGLRFIEVDEAPDRVAAASVREVMAPLLAQVRAAAEAGDATGALRASAAARILCAHRHGPYGVSRWNELAARWSGAGGALWYPGRPLLVTRNEPRLGLANGDIGVVVRDGDAMVAVFGSPDDPRRFDPVQLDQVETAYAMTVHKSQGSEYPTVVVVLPPATSPLVGRELLYTAVTRARQSLVVVGSAAAVGACVAAPARRMTGLADALARPANDGGVKS